MHKLLLTGLAGATALATGTPAQAHPNWHYEGGCGFFTISDGTNSPTTQWEGEIHVVATATEAVVDVPAPTASISVDCELRINGATPGTIVFSCSTPGIGFVSCAGQFAFTADPEDIVSMCDIVTVNGEVHKDCSDSTTTPIVPEPIQNVIEDFVGCDDGLDNDADGRIDSADPGCASHTDPDERGDTACDDDADNDGDLLSDYPADPGCTGPADTDEAGPAACDDGVDNDGDLAADTSDPGCSGPSDTDERGTGTCDDGADNDSDGAADYPQDAGCDGPGDSSERSATFPCDDGADNDGDQLTDYPADPGCRSAVDPNETTIP